MRIFFVLLLLANAGFFAWQYQQSAALAGRENAPEDFQALDPGIAPLVLLGERPAPPAAAPTAGAEALSLSLAAPEDEEPVALQMETDSPADVSVPEQIIEAAPESAAQTGAVREPSAEPAAQAVPAVARYCLDLGPSADRAAIERAADAARQAGARIDIRESAQTGAGGYWVRLPENYSLGEARARYRELQKKGIDDIAIVPLPDDRYFISLGVYKRKDTVEDRRQEILARGVTPVIEDRAQSTALFTLAVEYAGADPAPLRDRLSEQAPQLALREVVCR